MMYIVSSSELGTSQTVRARTDSGFIFTAVIESERDITKNVHGGMISNLFIVSESDGRVIYDFADGVLNYMDDSICEALVKIWLTDLAAEIILRKARWDTTPLTDEGHRDKGVFIQGAWNTTSTH